MPNVAIGDYVLVAKAIRTRHHKLNVKWMGPYVVTDTVSPHVFVVQLIGGNQRTKRRVHARRLKRYSDRLLNVTQRLVNQAHFDLEEFEVETIKDIRHRNGEYELKIGWLGYEEYWDTWEPLIQMLADIPRIVHRFLGEHVARNPDLRRFLP